MKLKEARPLKPESQVVKPCCYQVSFLSVFTEWKNADFRLSAATCVYAVLALLLSPSVFCHILRKCLSDFIRVLNWAGVIEELKHYMCAFFCSVKGVFVNFIVNVCLDLLRVVFVHIVRYILEPSFLGSLHRVLMNPLGLLLLLLLMRSCLLSTVGWRKDGSKAV